MPNIWLLILRHSVRARKGLRAVHEESRISEETWEFQASDSELRIVYILGQKIQDVCVRGTHTLSYGSHR